MAFENVIAELDLQIESRERLREAAMMAIASRKAQIEADEKAVVIHEKAIDEMRSARNLLDGAFD